MPIHISKPYWDGSSLLLNVMSPTAGMLEGDSVEVDVSVRPGSSLTLSNPTSLRVHKMSEQGEACWHQKFRVSPHGFLECNPEWLMLQAESAFEQTTEIVVEEEGELFFLESLAPGRIAHGEHFAFRSFKNRLRLRFAGELAACEKHHISPQRGSEIAWAKSRFKAPFYASLFLVSKKLNHAQQFFDLVYEMHGDALAIGASPLVKGPCWNVKALSDDPALLRATIAKVRNAFYASIGRPPTDLRR